MEAATRMSSGTGSQSLTLLGELKTKLPLAQIAAPIAALIVLSVGFQLISGSFFTIDNLKSVVEAAAVPAILAAAISFVVIMGSIDLSLEGIMAATSMIVALLVANGVNGNDYGVMGLLIALAAGLGFGLFNAVLNAVLKMPSLIVTLGTWFIGLGIAALLFPARVPQINDPFILDLARFRIFDISLVVYIALAVIAVSELILNFTTFGRMIYAIGGDEGLLLASGLRVRRFKIIAFAICGVLAGVCGVLLSAQLSTGNANIGSGLLFPAISAAVLGGTVLTGGRGGAVQSALGALILEVLNNGLIQIGAGPYTRNVISGAVIVVAVAAGGWHRRRKMRVVK
ncbi:ABC transporter permease [Rhizobium johnstonii]|uniref:ABC transporter permease n=2 Tax=Rhizobium TaxID=379 RepID=UPI0010310250|nr:ABC transporter permease [Rhizobium leguminosarum]TBF70723.1 ABC transporter permease [Rhizobium leguminosarum]TBG93407.1 ABC transporter permease [Rhizobium leguminosarum]TBG95973.1 ABC transporter permease [Rhizobium leguminosarum]TBH28787.1 ABC transporter permease [Rhizobium leguminosarum]TBH50232.1 ABC transporter permease [Rhizobium leguminosarum]